eukprot:jgi/Tetstr1/463895/TSEL_008706.t1
MLAPCSVGGSQRLPVAAAVAPLVSRQRPRQHRHSRPPHDFTAHANAGISGGNSRPRSDCTCRASASDSPPPMGKPGRRGYRYVWHSTDEDWNSPFLAPEIGEAPPVIVALGKFDAMHKGHRALAVAAAEMGGQPWLLSFSGMSEVLGWPARKPLVADCDRPRVLASWGPQCAEVGRAPHDDGAGYVPQQRSIPFAEIRRMPPAEFVALLAGPLQVAGVVAGENYRFGFKAAGDAEQLVALGAQHGLRVRILELVGAGEAGMVGQVSSSRVRDALASGGERNMRKVHKWLGRCYRAVAELSLTEAAAKQKDTLRLSSAAFLNLLPGDGRYACRVGVCQLEGPHLETSFDQEHGAWRDGVEVAVEGGDLSLPLWEQLRAAAMDGPPPSSPHAIVRVIVDFVGDS